MATYELWETQTSNLVGSWASEAEALTVVNDALVRHGADALTTLSLLHEDSQGNTTVIAEGPSLIERARGSTPTTEQRSA